jgi:hypothetical protein
MDANAAEAGAALCFARFFLDADAPGSGGASAVDVAAEGRARPTAAAPLVGLLRPDKLETRWGREGEGERRPLLLAATESVCPCLRLGGLRVGTGVKPSAAATAGAAEAAAAEAGAGGGSTASSSICSATAGVSGAGAAKRGAACGRTGADAASGAAAAAGCTTTAAPSAALRSLSCCGVMCSNLHESYLHCPVKNQSRQEPCGGSTWSGGWLNLHLFDSLPGHVLLWRQVRHMVSDGSAAADGPAETEADAGAPRGGARRGAGAAPYARA